MEAVTALLALTVALLVIVLVRQNGGRTDGVDRQDIESMRAEMRDNLSQVRDTVQSQVGGLRLEVGNRLDNTGVTMSQVQTKLGELSEATKHIQEISKDIASLQDILQPPKLRGALGELLLERLLAQVLPAHNFSLQYGFRDGKIVDAVITLGKGQMVPVDSKFPLETFRRLLDANDTERGQRHREFVRNVRQHVDRVADYIRPDEGTLNFALMYVPAENVFYETIVKSDEADDDLYNYCLGKRVMPVSPQSFYAYLGAIALGLKGMVIEQSAELVMAHLSRLNDDFRTIADDYATLGSHITHAANKYGETQRRLDRFGTRLSELPNPVGIAQLPLDDDR